MTFTKPLKWYNPVQALLLSIASVLVGFVAFGVTLEGVFGPNFVEQDFNIASTAQQRYVAVAMVGGIVGLVLAIIQTFRTRRDKVQLLDYAVLVFTFSPFVLLPALITLVGILSRLQWRPAAWAVVVSVAATAIDLALDPTQQRMIEVVLGLLLVYALVTALALWFGRRRERREAQTERLRAAEGKLATMRAEERARIARDLHDSLSHRLSLISLHAGALAYRDDLSEADVVGAASTLQDSARQANEDLRSILAVLREGDEPVTDPGRPIADLIAQARAAGREVKFDVVSERIAEEIGEQPSLVAHAVNRTVSEGLLNASKHAHGAAVTIAFSRLVDQPGTWVRLSVANPITEKEPGAGSRAGIVGLQERATAAGGQLTVKTDAEFALELEVPWTT